MAQLVWDKVGEKTYETGVSKGVLYPFNSTTREYGNGIAWNGLISVSESPEGGEPNPFYADNQKYLNIMSVEEFKASISAYMYPKEFAECDGSAQIAPGAHIGQQSRKSFGLCYRTECGNDTEGNDYGYKLHFVYGAQVTPSQKEYSTINNSPSPIEFSWSMDTTPVEVAGYKPTASLVINSWECDEDNLKALEEYIYGTGTGTTGTAAKLPLPAKVAEILNASKTLTTLVQKTAPTKTTYTAGETFDSTGFVATATFDDASTLDITADKMTYAPTAMTSGVTQVVASYTYKTVTKTVNIAVTVS